ncbi:MAG: RHS repeat-associated core domain-containing protein [Bacteroidota bacterium]
MFVDENEDGWVDPDPVNGEVLQETHFYPFGLTMADASSTAAPAVSNNYLFTGKEYQNEYGIGWIDFGARMYDASIARWNGVDALTEEYTVQSPYLYAGNNPILFVDFDGRDYGVEINHKDGTISIYATYIVNSEDENEMNEIKKFWERQDDKFVYVVGEGADAITYNISFRIDVQVNDNKSSNPSQKDYFTAGYDRAQLGHDTDSKNELNSFVLSDEHPLFQKKTNGETKNGTSGGYSVVVRKSGMGAKRLRRGKHETGHNFGMGHRSGLMNESSGSSMLDPSNVGETLYGIGLGSVKNIGSGGDNATNHIRSEKGIRPNNFHSGTVMTKKRYEKKKNRAIKKRRKKN